ncbi:hypothetical protein GFC01_09095 [Desulfofundulus thermobenzoicus]|uniref:Polymer-forming cytoskeletal protein n=1 Tax=Desulfofundulus thermobenzoicus TaxID=29376 RepID=A0A6N7IQS5_9FIRM|nr:polymer-forming cytoskeletal protein [Desulfofundulus thermobenzoicus]MQL52416.1 hypothetical protein [Desulfofundulus thermobenzoicus]
MERKWNTVAITLTFRREPDYIDVDKAIDRLFNALRAVARRKEWRYRLSLSLCLIDPRTGREVAPHIHGTLTACPGSTVADWIHRYWHRRQGIVHWVTADDPAGWEQYIDKQRTFTRTQTNMAQQPTPPALMSQSQTVSSQTAGDYQLDAGVNNKLMDNGNLEDIVNDDRLEGNGNPIDDDNPVDSATPVVIHGGLAVHGDLVVRGRLSVHGNLEVSGRLTVPFDLEIHGDLVVHGNLTVHGDLSPPEGGGNHAAPAHWPGPGPFGPVCLHHLPGP